MDDLTLVQHMARYVLHRFPDILEFDELVSEGWIFIVGLREKGTYDPGRDDWEAYAKRCVVRRMLVALAYQRKQGFRYAPQKTDVEQSEYDDEIGSPYTANDSVLEIDVMMNELLEKMKKVLLVEEFILLKEYFCEDYTFVELGKKHNLSKTRIEQLIKRALNILKDNDHRPNRLL
jgi:RNA polymerase sigma factor (sigma-70 family)